MTALTSLNVKDPSSSITTEIIAKINDAVAFRILNTLTQILTKFSNEISKIFAEYRDVV